jgi:hypothetical protein
MIVALITMGCLCFGQFVLCAYLVTLIAKKGDRDVVATQAFAKDAMELVKAQDLQDKVVSEHEREKAKLYMQSMQEEIAEKPKAQVDHVPITDTGILDELENMLEDAKGGRHDKRNMVPLGELLR